MLSNAFPKSQTRSTARLVFVWLCLALTATAHATDGDDPTKIVTTEFDKTPCRECHLSEFDVWQKTTHATGFKTMHRKDSAREIAAKMGVRLIKRNSPCMDCHYTAVPAADQLRAISGVSCESCHGAGADYVDIHNDYGGKGITADTETPEHRAARIKASIEGGMRRPSDIYDLAATCYQCHTVPDEALVNTGGHGSGSAAFELVEWTQGKIRHNFLDSFIHGDGTVNAERQPPHKRRLFVTGKALAVEYGLRAMANASESGRYAKTKERWISQSTRDLGRIQRALDLPELKDILGVVGKVAIKPNNREALITAADSIETATRQFLINHADADLSAVDKVMEGGGEDFADDTPLPSGNTSTVTVTGRDQPAVSAALPGGFQPTQHGAIGPGRCLSCHAPQEDWWYGDDHFSAADPFLDRAPKNVEIARNYGLTADQMTRGGSRCMDCHGAIITGRENREVNDGVGCESCHGPGADYLKPHQEGDKNAGAERSGYVASLKLGLTDLRAVETRAQACVSCHFITEKKLLEAGHPTGEGFDYESGIAKVKHWNRPEIARGVFASSTAAARQARGPIPDFQVVRSSTPVNVSAEVADRNRDTIEPPTQADSTSQKSTPSTGKQASVKKTSLGLATRVRPVPAHDTLGPSRCVSCHQPQEKWWVDNPHGRSTDAFFDQEPKNIKIARLYGLTADQMTKGNQICMDCHGSVVTGRERRDVSDGTGCEDCHGPGKDYLKPHQEGDIADGLARTGYKLGLEAGMKELKNLNVRAKACAECHYIDQPRLLSAGHPTGKDFDYVAGMKKVRHWQAPPVSANQLHTAFARFAPTGQTTAVTTNASSGNNQAAQTANSDETNATPAENGDETTESPTDSPPEENLSVEEKLLRLKKRLEELRRTLPAGKDQRP